MSDAELNQQIDWTKGDGLVPAIVQDAFDGRVLMLGYMSPESLQLTLETRKVAFFSRSRQTLWTKGETSGNTLDLESIHLDCDRDTLLVLARPHGPTCHTGTASCFDGNQAVAPALARLARLEQVISARRDQADASSYVSSLFQRGTSRMAQKVGEEGLEVALAGVKGDREELANEGADLIFHLMILLQDQGLSLADVLKVLKGREK